MAKEDQDLSKLSPIIFNGMPLVNLSALPSFICLILIHP